MGRVMAKSVEDLQAACGDMQARVKELSDALRNAESAEDENDVRANLEEAHELALSLADDLFDLLEDEEEDD